MFTNRKDTCYKPILITLILWILIGIFLCIFDIYMHDIDPHKDAIALGIHINIYIYT